ncbi:DUF4407 domain-containing protein [Sphingobacterium sp.]|uniref:DUF4407 domain-containing protein n=1 Tax=Sphingobacterium sp. TaxID=341027 RepID=UPI0031DF3EE9
MKYSLSKFEHFLFFFSSEDVYVIERYIQLKEENKEYKIKYYFLTIGLAVLIFFICAAISTMFFIYNIFDGYSRLLSLPIGLFIGLLIANIYLFLLYTITPTILDTVDKKKKNDIHIKDIKNTQESTSIFSFSFLFRLAFIAFIGLIIAQPLNVWLLVDMNPLGLGNKEIVQIERYKSESLVDSYLTNDDHYTKNEIVLFKDINEKLAYIEHGRYDLSEIKSIINTINQKVKEDESAIKQLNQFKYKLNRINRNFLKKRFNYQETAALTSQINGFVEQMAQSDHHFLDKLEGLNRNKSLDRNIFGFYLQNAIPLIEEKIESHDQLKQLLDKNTLYTLKIKLLMAENPFALIVAILTISVFCIPVFAKFFIRSKFNYYKFRAGSEKTIISRLYEIHRKTYADLINTKLKAQLDNSNEYLLQKLAPVKRINTPLYHYIENDLLQRTHREEIEKFEYWNDAPFRTQRKSDVKLPNKEDLINKLYN